MTDMRYEAPKTPEAAVALLTGSNGRASVLAGNLCRCTAYHKIVPAVRDAAREMRGD